MLKKKTMKKPNSFVLSVTLLVNLSSGIIVGHYQGYFYVLILSVWLVFYSCPHKLKDVLDELSLVTRCLVWLAS